MNRRVRATGEDAFRLAPSNVLLARKCHGMSVYEADRGKLNPHPS